MRKLVLASCLVAAFSAVVPLQAQAKPAASARRWRSPTLVSVSLVDHEGMQLRSAKQQGVTFVAGERGQGYAIAITNKTSQRLEVVVTVDGRDVVSGKRGDDSTQRGYVLEAFQTIEIDGFRQSLSRVAAFRFADVEDSYAARNGDASQAGVVRVAVFREKQKPTTSPPLAKSAKKRPAASAPSASATRDGARARQDLGTEYGESRTSVVRRVAFERMNPTRPDFRTVLFYDSARALAERGIRVDGEALELVDGGFAPPPPRRR